MEMLIKYCDFLAPNIDKLLPHMEVLLGVLPKTTPYLDQIMLKVRD